MPLRWTNHANPCCVSCQASQQAGRGCIEKPEFIIVRYGETDEVLPRHGPSSDEDGEACGRADAWLAKVVPWLRARGYAIIITADHGQHDVENKEGKITGAHGSDSDADCLVPLVWLRPGD